MNELVMISAYVENRIEFYKADQGEQTFNNRIIEELSAIYAMVNSVLVVENNKLPRVNIQLTMDRPPIYEGNIVGVGEIMADQLGTGTTKLSKEEFNKKIDFLGARLNFYAQGAGANTLSKYSTQVISLMADAIINTIEEHKLKPSAILLTHGHFDHIMAVNDLVEKYKAYYIIGMGKKQICHIAKKEYRLPFFIPIVLSYILTGLYIYILTLDGLEQQQWDIFCFFSTLLFVYLLIELIYYETIKKKLISVILDGLEK